MEALKVEQLSLNFGGLKILNNVSLSIEAGERVAIIGPNGAGKTTLLNVIDGGLPATHGHAYLFGQDVTTMPTHERAQMGLARSFQVLRLLSGLTVLDNITLALFGKSPARYQMYRSSTAYDELRSKGQKLLTQVDLWKKKDELVRNLSHGEQRILDVALSLASEPKVLLLDEPTAGLTGGEVPDLVNVIKALTEDTTVFFAAHDMDVVLHLAERVVTLYFGVIIADGTIKEVQANPTVREIYLGAEEVE